MAQELTTRTVVVEIKYFFFYKCTCTNRKLQIGFTIGLLNKDTDGEKYTKNVWHRGIEQLKREVHVKLPSS